MQSTNFKYESPYLATRHFNFTMQLLGCSVRLLWCCYAVYSINQYDVKPSRMVLNNHVLMYASANEIRQQLHNGRYSVNNV